MKAGIDVYERGQIRYWYSQEQIVQDLMLCGFFYTKASNERVYSLLVPIE